MYPKVRVRVEDDDAAAENQLHFEKFHSIPVESSDRYSKGNKDQQETVENKTKHNQENCDDSKPNIRASLVPRPRAVLSSPVNDGMIGIQSRLSKGAAIRKHEHGHNTNLQGKLNPKIAQPQTETTTVRKTRASPSVISQFNPLREGPSATLIRRPHQKFVSDPKAKKQGTFTGKAKNIV